MLVAIVFGIEILEELTRPSDPAADVGDSWSEEDLRDVAAFSLGYAADSYPKNDDLV